MSTHKSVNSIQIHQELALKILSEAMLARYVTFSDKEGKAELIMGSIP